MTTPTTVPLAVYGTLRRGFENHTRYLSARTARFEGWVRIPFRMFATEAYPMLVASDLDHDVFVEIFALDPSTLAVLDALEEPYGYRRQTVDVKLGERRLPVELYVYRGVAPPAGFRPVESGCWDPPPNRTVAVPPSVDPAI